MLRAFVTSKHGAVVWLLRLTVAILCMEACATVAVILTANGVAKSNATDYRARQPIEFIRAKGRSGGIGILRNAIVKASTVDHSLQSMPSSLGTPTSHKARKLALTSPLHSVDTASSLLHSEVVQTPPPSTTTPGSTAPPRTNITGSSTAAPPTSTVVTSTLSPSSTTSGAARAVTPAPSTTVPPATPPPPVIPIAASTAPPTVVPGTLPPTPPPVPRWAQGGLATMHGCECADSWQLNGLTLRGCVVSSDVRMPWCIVKDPATCRRGYTNSALPITATVTSAPNQNPRSPLVINGTWDFCTMPDDVSPHMTLASCHCLPLWEHGGVAYSGCNRTLGDPSGKSWCYIAETGGKCTPREPDGTTKLQRWDLCDPPANAPSFMTKNSCHCKPRWTHLGHEYTNCVQDELVTPPANVNTTNTSIKKEMLGWCQVFEDERICPNVELTETGVLWDTCFFLDEATRAELPPTMHGCHCLPEWTQDGILYSGCAWTPLAKASWCPVVEDEATCSNSLSPTDSTFGAGHGKRRWDWCSVTNPRDPSQPWRLATERFTPKDPSPPAWYQNVYDDLIASHNDLMNARRKEQASYAGRRRIP